MFELSLRTVNGIKSNKNRDKFLLWVPPLEFVRIYPTRAINFKCNNHSFPFL